MGPLKAWGLEGRLSTSQKTPPPLQLSGQTSLALGCPAALLVTQPQGPGQMGGGTREDTLGPKGELCACQLTLRIPGTREGKRQGYHQGDALGQDTRSCPSEVQIPIRIPPPASPPPCTLTPRIPPRNGLAHALLEVSNVLALMSPLPLRNPYFSGSPDPPTPRSPLLTCAAPRAITFAPGGVRPSRGSRVPPPPESSDAHSTTRPLPAALPGGHRTDLAQSGSGKPRPRRSCRTTWRRQYGGATASSDRSEATGRLPPGRRPGPAPPPEAQSLPGSGMTPRPPEDQSRPSRRPRPLPSRGPISP